MEVYRGNKIIKLTNKYCKIQNPKVLDVGCGLNNEFFNFKYYTGVDVRDYHKGFNVVLKDLSLDPSLPFDDNTFDVVMATEFLEHVFRPDLLSKEINRVVKNDGVIIISLPNEFTLNCRLGFMAGMVLNKGFDLYTHKYIFNLAKIEEFMHDNFITKERDLACLGHFWENMPDSVNEFMVKLSPQLFAKSVIYACAKKS